MKYNEWFPISDLPDEQYEASMTTAKAIRALMESTEPPYAITAIVGAVCNYIYAVYDKDRHKRIIELMMESCFVTLDQWAIQDEQVQ